MINVLIVEDDPMASQLMEVYLSKGGNYNLVQTVESAMFAEVVCKSKPVDVILMDVCTALNANGIEAARSIKKSFPEIKIIIITSQPEHSFIERAKAAGVESFWYKNGAAEELLSIMERTILGEKVYPETTPTVKLGASYSEKLSDRELDGLAVAFACRRREGACPSGDAAGLRGHCDAGFRHPFLRAASDDVRAARRRGACLRLRL